MKAVIYNKQGSPEKMTLQEIEKPIPNDDEMLIKIVATSLNAYDYRSIQVGKIPQSGILGEDIAGRVEAVGKNIKTFKEGDEVFGDISAYGSGGLAEYVALPERAVALKPSKVSFEDAAAVPMAALTALQGLRDYGKIQPGYKVLICGAGGGVGTFAVQLAKYFGAEVTAICGTQNVELIRSLGADNIKDYSKEDFSKNSLKYDLILGVNGNHSLATYKRLLTSNGIFVMAGGSYTQLIKQMIFGKLMSLGSRKMLLLVASSKISDQEMIIKLVEEGKIKPVIDRRYPLEEAVQAMAYLKQGHTRGKVIITITRN